MKQRTTRMAKSLAMVLIATGAACGPGIRSHPGGTGNNGGPSGTAGATGSNDAGTVKNAGDAMPTDGVPTMPAPLPTDWAPCGILGSGRVQALAFSPFGNAVAMGHGAGTVRMLSWPDAVAATSVGAHTQAVSAVTFSPLGDFLATGAGSEIRLWRTDGLVGVRTISAGMNPRRLLFSPDQTTLLALDQGTPGAVKVWNTTTGRQVGGDLTGVEAAFLANSQAVRTFDGASSVLETTLATGNQTTLLLQGAPKEAVLSHDGTMLAGTTGEYRQVAMWRVADGKRLWIEPVNAGDVTNDATRLFFTSADQTLVVVRNDRATARDSLGGAIKQQTALPAAMVAMDLLGNGGVLAGTLADGSVGQVSLDARTVEPTLPSIAGHTGPAYALSRSPDGRYLASTGFHTQPRIFLWDLTTIAAVGTLPGTEGFNVGTTFSPDGRFIGVFGDGAYVARIPDGRRVLSAAPSPIVATNYAGYQLAFGPQFTGTGAVALGIPGGAHVQTITLGASEQTLQSPDLPEFPSTGDSTPGIAFSPDGKRLATAASMWSTEDNSLLWSVADPTLQPATLDAVPGSWAAFSPDGTLVVVSTCPALGDRCVAAQSRVLLASTGKLVREIGGGRHPVFSGNGTAVLAGNTLTDIATGAVTFLPVTASVSLFASDRLIVAAGDDGSLRMLCPR